jgi:hypothetical protein
MAGTKRRQCARHQAFAVRVPAAALCDVEQPSRSAVGGAEPPEAVGGAALHLRGDCRLAVRERQPRRTATVRHGSFSTAAADRHSGRCCPGSRQSGGRALPSAVRQSGTSVPALRESQTRQTTVPALRQSGTPALRHSGSVARQFGDGEPNRRGCGIGVADADGTWPVGVAGRSLSADASAASLSPSFDGARALPLEAADYEGMSGDLTQPLSESCQIAIGVREALLAPCQSRCACRSTVVSGAVAECTNRRGSSDRSAHRQFSLAMAFLTVDALPDIYNRTSMCCQISRSPRPGIENGCWPALSEGCQRAMAHWVPTAAPAAHPTASVWSPPS